ncbi:hypothetical protein AB1L42_01435 [Thalassoglobus sp. JC818]|uniref:hypothetical protein n=1 Tax=Thalassoglobus sp. JC818 TaxID=3232136 RepID=UPI003457B7FC
MKHKLLITLGFLFFAGGCNPPGGRERVQSEVIGPENDGVSEFSHSENPVWTVLDHNGDGELSDQEMGSASESLRSLDQNQDDVLTYPELLKNQSFLEQERQSSTD